MIYNIKHIEKFPFQFFYLQIQEKRKGKTKKVRIKKYQSVFLHFDSFYKPISKIIEHPNY